MLQQTVAKVVIPYFERWMVALPDLSSLANASKEEVFKLWEGLGYYSRARNLMKGACYVMTHFDGQLPRERHLLQTIPGIGPYTSAAISAFSFGQKIAAVDANVARFISRYLALEDKTLLESAATELLPDEAPALVAEAMIEIGATICRKKPDCLNCPVQSSCKAFAEQRQHELPVAIKRAAITYLEKRVFILYHEGRFLLKEPSSTGVMADLFEFPTDLSLSLDEAASLTPQKHSFTRYQATLYPFFLAIKDVNSCPQRGFSWYSLTEMQKLTFSAGHKRILKELNDHFAYGSLPWVGGPRNTHIGGMPLPS